MAITLETLSPSIISRIEREATKAKLSREKRGYKTGIVTIAQMVGTTKDNVDAVINAEIGETWKTIKPRFNRYKISNFGRVKGPAGTILSSYVSKSGTELVDPYDVDGNRKHLSIKKAVCDAFMKKPKKNEKIRYKSGARINTVLNLVVA